MALECLCLDSAHRLLFRHSQRNVAGWLTKSLVASVLIPVSCEVVTQMHVTRGGRDLSSIGALVCISLTKDSVEFSTSSGTLSGNITIRCAAQLQCCD